MSAEPPVGPEPPPVIPVDVPPEVLVGPEASGFVAIPPAGVPEAPVVLEVLSGLVVDMMLRQLMESKLKVLCAREMMSRDKIRQVPGLSRRAHNLLKPGSP